MATPYRPAAFEIIEMRTVFSHRSMIRCYFLVGFKGLLGELQGDAVAERTLSQRWERTPGRHGEAHGCRDLPKRGRSIERIVRK